MKKYYLIDFFLHFEFERQKITVIIFFYFASSFGQQNLLEGPKHRVTICNVRKVSICIGFAIQI